MNLENKVALVTGGGRGIGRGIVERFLEEGARVAIVQRSAVDPDLREDPRVMSVLADLSNTTDFAPVVDRVARHWGGLDILVNNAGIMFERSVAEITEAEWNLMAATNLRAPLFMCQAALPHLRQRRGASIINIGSIEGIGANPGHAAYSATKAGLHGMTRALAVDLGAEGIRCNAIAPGWIASDLSEAYLDSFRDPAEARRALDRLHPVGRVGQGADIGDVAVFLASDQSRFITGETLVVDGGRTAKLPLPQ